MNDFKTIVYAALFRLVERDHGGCDQEDCSLRQAIEDGDDELAIQLWAYSGAACDRFNRIYERYLVKKDKSA
jgi:hypothetical protein